jgi:non-specific serine/threonine protein kinase/serine/threonine-protein kinase
MNDSEFSKIKEAFNCSLELPADERPAFLGRFSETVRTEVEQLLASHQCLEGFIAEPAVVELGFGTPGIPDQIDGYRIDRILGSGGMGTVYLGIHPSSGEQVAIKIVKRGMATDDIIRRFIAERRILAGLDHPFIARLEGGGMTEDGRPYFLMEYVDGVPVTTFCDRHRYGLRERLRIFRDICEAVSYSHRSLVLHRDLKPSNMLVTDNGTPKLLDFGIARVLDTRNRILTPEYASPEQIAGLTVTTASDVYSLGVVLYELLTGVRPTRPEFGQVPGQSIVASDDEPVRPSAARVTDRRSRKTADGAGEERPAIGDLSALRGDLDNIVLKALRRDVERRYRSVEELSEDIRRFQSGLPVSATADGRLYRFSKFVRRNRLATATVGLVLVLSIVSGWQAIVATRERQRAEKRFNQVRKLANAVLFDYQDGIERLPGATLVRQRMLADALEYLNNLSSETGNDRTLQIELAAAFHKMGDIQGNPFHPNLGDMTGALSSYEKALVIRKDLAASDSNDAGVRRQLASTFGAIADILWARGQNAEALENRKLAMAIDEELFSADPDNALNRFMMAKRLYDIGQTLRKMKEPDAALKSFRQSLELYSGLLESEPGNRDYRYAVAIGRLKIGDVSSDIGDHRGALEGHESASIILRELSERNDDANSRRTFALALGRIGDDHLRLGEVEEALRAFREAMSILERLLESDPENRQYRLALADSEHKLADALVAAKRGDKAVVYLRKAIGIFKESLAVNPDDAETSDALKLAELSLEKIGSGDIERRRP